jgi:preprotein translocase subunit YajC
VELLILVFFGFVAMWVFVVLPQRRRMAAHDRMVDDLKVGDEVLTAGGLFGDVTEIGEDEVAVEIAPGVEVRVAARAIASVIPPETYEDDDGLGDDASDGAGPAERADGASPDGGAERMSTEHR